MKNIIKDENIYNNQYDKEYKKLNKFNIIRINVDNIYKNLNLKNILYCFLVLFIIMIIFKEKNEISEIKIISNSLKKYVNDCNNFKRYKRIKIKKDYPYLSICLSAPNYYTIQMLYLAKNIL